MVTVEELITMLEEVEDKTRIVICASDAEGNSHFPLSPLIGESKARDLGYEYELIYEDEDEEEECEECEDCGCEECECDEDDEDEDEDEDFVNVLVIGP